MSPKKALSTEPIYNIKSVAEMTGIPPVTLRAWERRYGFPSPERTGSGYRLYSEHDVASLNWLKLQTDSGLSIAQAVKLFHSIQDTGANPADPQARLEGVSVGGKSIEQFQREFTQALLDLDEARAYLVMRTALSFYPLDSVLLEVISPTMVEIGERWHNGEINIATEHFATHHCRLHLMNAIESTREVTRKGSIVVACAPYEMHELGALTLVAILRWRGWHVTYLGANLSLDRLHETLALLKPQMLLFSATRVESAEALAGLTQVLEALPHPRPVVGLGGLAFQVDPTLTNRVPGTYIGPDARLAVDQIERILGQY